VTLGSHNQSLEMNPVPSLRAGESLRKISIFNAMAVTYGRDSRVTFHRPYRSVAPYRMSAARRGVKGWVTAGRDITQMTTVPYHLW